MTSAGHRLTLILLAAGLLLRLLVPSGWMPSATGGMFAIEPCPAAQAAPIMVMASHHHDGSHKAQHDGDCAFAPFAGDFAASDTPVGTAVPMERTLPPPHSPSPFFSTGPPALLPPATGPPALA